MSRLIDADKLKEEMNRKFHEIKHTSPDFLAEGFVQIDMLIDDQPTACDTVKVVEQIHDYFKGQLDIRYETLKLTDERRISAIEIRIGAIDDLLSHNKAVCNIVKKGGISNE